MNSFTVWYIDANGNPGKAFMHGPRWQKAWQTIVTTLYLNDPANMPVLLLCIEKQTNDGWDCVYESPYLHHILETTEHGKELYNQLATATHSPVACGVGNGS